MNEKPCVLKIDADSEPTRYHLLDSLRGIMIIGVVINHFIMNLETLGFNINVLHNPLVSSILDAGRFMFVFLAGITCNLSRSNFIRGLKALGFAFGITLITYIFLREYFIFIGILHLLGLCMVLYALIEKLNPFAWVKNKKLGSAIGFILMLTLYIITHGIYYKSKGLWFFSYYPIRKVSLYGTFLGYILGFGGAEYFSADYFPLIPWSFIFFAGAFIGYFFKHKLVPEFLKKPIYKPLTVVGRHTLIIYVLHQPAAYGLAWLLALWFLK